MAVERNGNPNRKWLCNWFAFCITTIRWGRRGSSRNRTMMMKKGKGMERLRPTTRTALLQGKQQQQQWVVVSWVILLMLLL